MSSPAGAARLVLRLGLGPITGTESLPGRRPGWVVRTRHGGWLVRDAAEGAGAETGAARLTVALDHPVSPRLLADDESGALVCEWLSGWETLHARFERASPDELDLAAGAGRALARLHGIVAPAELGVAPASLTGLGAPELPGAAELPGDSLELIGELQSTPGLLEALDELAVPGPDRRLVHGDVKLDNVLAPGDGRPEVRLVDWELSGAGDPMGDLGSLAGDYLSRWLQSAEPRRGAGLADWFASAAVPRRRAVSAVSAAVDGYTSAGGALDMVALARFAGVFLLGRAFSWIEVVGQYSARVHVLVQAARRLVLQPETAGQALLG